MAGFKKGFSRLADWGVAGCVAALAAALFLPLTSDCAFPGESATLSCVWAGLDVAERSLYPLMRAFWPLLGGGNLAAAVCGVLACVLVFHLSNFFLRECTGGEFRERDAAAIGRIGGFATAAVFMFSQSVLDAATHLEPRLFDAAWALATLALIFPHARLPGAVAWLAPVAMGAAAAAGVADTSAFLLLAPFYAAAAWSTAAKRGGRGYAAAALFILAFAATLFAWTIPAIGDIDAYAEAQKAAWRLFTSPADWYVVPLFATLPFFVAVFSARRTLGMFRGWRSWSFLMLMTLVSMLATATELSPSAALRPTQVPPVVATFFASATAGWLVACWWSQTRHISPVNESESVPVPDRLAARVGWGAGGVFLAVLLVACLVNRFVSFDASRGDFADRAARIAIQGLAGRTWLVTDGRLDSHLLLEAKKAGIELNLVSLLRERDKAYIDDLAERVEKSRLLGDRTGELSGILVKHPNLDRKRIVPFIQKWFSEDPDIAKKAAVFGAPDLWLYAGVEPVAELLFFGGDPALAGDLKRWPELDSILHAPKGWGSASLYSRTPVRMFDHLESQRLNLRRHVGFVATVHGYGLQIASRDAKEAGDSKAAEKAAEKAFETYELVLENIDADNVAALFNEFELARSGICRPAAAKLKAITAKLDRLKEDGTRRYALGDMSLLYGYICNPEAILRYGLSLLLKSGRPGDAVNQIRRAIEFVPAENRAMAELNLLASIYASGADREKARKIYGDALVRDPKNRQALAGLARLAMMDGDAEKAKRYLEQATDGIGNDMDMFAQIATLHLMNDRIAEAKTLLRKVTDANPSNMEAWSLLAAAVMREIDTMPSGSPDAAARKAALEKELDDGILASMEARAKSPSDHNLLMAKAFAMMRKPGEDSKRGARDAFISVARDRPDLSATSDMILGLDIQLNDTADAERQAVETLVSKPKDPLANYVLGSLSLGKGEMEEAEKYLRVAAEAKRPVTLALNDLAEVLRRKKDFEGAEAFARKAVEAAPQLYVAWETLGSVLMDSGKAFDEAEQCIRKAVELSKDANGRAADARILISLARVQFRRGEKARGKGTLRSVLARIDELSEFERRELEELRKSAR